MSVRAYKITKIEYEKEPTFNLWHDTFITDNIGGQQYQDEYGNTAQIQIEKQQIQNLLDNFEEEWKEYQDEDKTEENKRYYKTTLKNMLKDCNEWDYVEYICF